MRRTATTLSALHHRDLGIPSQSFINGEFVFRAGLTSYAHVNPTTGEKQAELRLGGLREIDEAVQAAKKAQSPRSG